MQVEVSLASIRPNPYRNLDSYPLDPEKVKRLRASIHRTDFWENIVVRRVGATYELAYGHHRVQALREELGSGAKVSVIVKDIDDKTMLQMMAADNDDKGIGAGFILEVVEAAAKYFGVTITGLTHSARPSRRGKIAKQGSPYDGAPEFAGRLAKFLGWKRSLVQPALATLSCIKNGSMVPEVTSIVPQIWVLRELAHGFKIAAASGRPVPRATQIKIAHEIAKASGGRIRMAKAVTASLVHPDTGDKSDEVTSLLKKAASQAHALDVTLTTLGKHHAQLHGPAYRNSLGAATLAASLKGIVETATRVFTRKQLAAPPAAQEEAHALQK